MTKLNFFFLAILTLALFASASPVERKFDIRVSLTGTTSRIDIEEAIVKVRITNRGRENLQAGGLGEVNFFFSSCQAGDRLCRGENIYYAPYSIPSKSLFPDQSYEFEVDLGKLAWRSGSYNPQNSTPPVSLTAIPSKNIYFYSDVKILDGYERDYISGKREPRFREYFSNTINVILE